MAVDPTTLAGELLRRRRAVFDLVARLEGLVGQHPLLGKKKRSIDSMRKTEHDDDVSMNDHLVVALGGGAVDAGRRGGVEEALGLVGADVHVEVQAVVGVGVAEEEHGRVEVEAAGDVRQRPLLQVRLLHLVAQVDHSVRFTGFYLVFLSLHLFLLIRKLVVLGFTEFYLVLLGFTEFYLALLGFT